MKEKANLDAIASMLGALRRRTRMSQRELGRRSDLSYAVINDLERAAGYSPSPSTLRALARGLATYEVDDDGRGTVDQNRARAYFRQLMSAAGYLDGFAADEPTEESVRTYLTSRSGDAAFTERLLLLAEQYPEMPATDRMLLDRIVDTVLRPAEAAVAV